jgi:hypothetical protein
VLYVSDTQNVSGREAPANHPAFCGTLRKHDVTLYYYYVFGQTDGFYVTFRTANDLRKKFLKLRDKMMTHPTRDSKKKVKLQTCFFTNFILSANWEKTASSLFPWWNT